MAKLRNACRLDDAIDGTVVNQLGHTTYDTLVKDFVRFRYKNTATRSRPAGIQSNDAVRVRVTSRKVRESRRVQAQKVWYLLRQQGF